MKNINIALVSCRCLLDKIEHNLAQMEKWVKKAKKKNVKIICFPEMNITGYGNVICDNWEDKQKNIFDTLKNMASKQDLTILAGMAEKSRDNEIFATHLVVKPNQNIEKYRKLYIPCNEKSFISPGKDIPIFEAYGIKFGIQLCYDAHFPELSTYMALRDVQIIFIPHASPRGNAKRKFKSWIRHLPARAYDNSVFIATCNQVGKNKNGLEFPGVSFILGPSGRLIKKSLSKNDSMITCQLKADDFYKIRNHKMRFFLPNRRNDLLNIEKIIT